VSYFLENTGNRKRIFLIFGITHRLLYIPIALIPLFVPLSHKVIIIWAVTILITLSSAGSSVVSVCFLSWMGALVPSGLRGRFFSKRTMIFTASGAVVGILVGIFLGNAPSFGKFAVVFIIAALFGFVDVFLFIWVKDPEMVIPNERISFFKLFKEPFKNNGYLKFIIFVSIWNFGVNFAGPFFNVYMLEYLKMSYFFMFLFTQIASNLSTIFVIRFWGKMVDRYGNKPVMTICCSCIIALPVFWCFTTSQNFYMVLILSLLGGLFWPGYDMTATNLSIWLAPEKNRSIYIANYALVTSVIGIAIAIICGGAFMEISRPVISHLSIPFVMGQKLTNFHVLFILSGLIRLCAVYFLLPRVNEKDAKPSMLIINELKDSITSKIRSDNMDA
jgi:MFS family permease